MMDDRREVIRVEGLAARYGDHVVLKDIDFQVYEGEIFGILGGSGCGKSTLLKHLIGILKPYAGRIIIDGEDLTSGDDAVLQGLVHKMGVLFQSGALLSSMTVGENIALPINEHTDISGDLARVVVRLKLQLVDLAGYERYLPEELSGGMKKRAALARAMALDPQILFFDEPSAGLDPVIAAELDNLVRTINKSLKTTMVIVTHDLDSIFGIIHRAIVLDKESKTIIAAGDPRDLRDSSESDKVRRFFHRSQD